MKGFIVLTQPPRPLEVIVKLLNPPTPGCDCIFCKTRPKPDAPFLASTLCHNTEEVKHTIEGLRKVSNFVAAVELESDTCFVYKATPNAIGAETDLMIIALGSYIAAARLLAHKEVEAFSSIQDGRRPVDWFMTFSRKKSLCESAYSFFYF